MKTTSKTLYVIQRTTGSETLYVEPAAVGCINWTKDVREARTWTSQKRAQTFADRWAVRTSGWNAQTDTQGLSVKRTGVQVVAKP